jgi:signal transduction histidine kinase
MQSCSDGARRPAERIRAAAQRMDVIIADLMDAARIESGRLVVECSDHDASALLQEAVDMFTELASSRQITLSAANGALGATVRCDRSRILQVLSNLIGNALKFTEPSREIEIGCARDGVTVVFFVRDAGPGIRPDDLSHVFDAYWQGEGPSMQKKGLGLGLTICSEIIEAHGGRIWVDSILGHGSTFSFSLPIANG